MIPPVNQPGAIPEQQWHRENASNNQSVKSAVGSKRREDEAAAALIDELEGLDPNPAPQNGHSNYFKLAILVGLFAITYWCFRGKGNTPPPVEVNGEPPYNL